VITALASVGCDDLHGQYVNISSGDWGTCRAVTADVTCAPCGGKSMDSGRRVEWSGVGGVGGGEWSRRRRVDRCG
jgi:hypothetical protein